MVSHTDRIEVVYKDFQPIDGHGLDLFDAGNIKPEAAITIRFEAVPLLVEALLSPLR